MKILTLLTILNIFVLNVFGQVTAITEKGDTINVYENGTWEPLNQEVITNELIGSVKATVEVDEFNKSKKIKTETWTRFGENKFKSYISGSIIKIDDLTVFIISYSGDLGCLSEYDGSLKIKLTNDEIIECAQISDTDCGDYPSAKYLPLTRDQLKDSDYKEIIHENINLLQTHDWEMIRLKGTEYYTDIYPRSSKKIEKPEQFFRQHLSATNSK